MCCLFIDLQTNKAKKASKIVKSMENHELLPPPPPLHNGPKLWNHQSSIINQSQAFGPTLNPCWTQFSPAHMGSSKRPVAQCFKGWKPHKLGGWEWTGCL